VHVPTVLEVRLHSRPQLSSSGQGPAKSPAKRLVALGTVIPLAEKRPPRSWRATNDRLRDQGDLTVLIDLEVLKTWRSKERGRAYAHQVIELCALLKAAYHLPFRQLEGMVRMMLFLMELPREMAPDYSTLSRRVPELGLPELPHSSSTEPLVAVMDSTGVRVSEPRGWHQDRNYAGDARRTKYLKLHLSIDALTGEICGWDITKSYGHGTGDNYVATGLVTQSARWASESGRHFSGGIGDGAYDSGELYATTRDLGGEWLAPLPANAVRGRHPDRNRHLVGVKRLGEVYHDRMGYHERSTIEATNGALKRSVNLSSRAHSFETQCQEIAWQLYFYAAHIARMPRDGSLVLTG